MAKQMRSPARRKPSSPKRAAEASDAPRPAARSSRAADPVRAASQHQPQRSTYIEAVAIYDKAMRALQQHHYRDAAGFLREIQGRFPEERELNERARLYLTLCERQLQPATAEPTNTRERLYAATLGINAGNFDQATLHLQQVLKDEPENDQALYMLATTYAQRGEPALAIRYLQQAIAANPENRARARADRDLDQLRDDETVTALLEIRPVVRDADYKRLRRR